MYKNWQVRDRRFRPPIKNYQGGEFKYAHLKRDGHMVRFELNVTHEGVKWKAFTRRPTDVSWSVYDCWQGLADLIYGLGMYSPDGQWVLMGEMYYPGKPASYVKTGLKHKDKTLQIQFFAVLETPWATVEELAPIPLEEVEDMFRVHSIPFVPYTCSSDVFSRFEELGEAGEDIEGFVTKEGNLIGWQKWKHKQTIDLICTGYIPGEGKYRGQIGSICGSVLLDGKKIEVATCSGMTDKERLRISQNMELYRDTERVFEVEYQLVGSNGRLRHPQFKLWRTDKFSFECTADQNPELQKYWQGAKNV